LRSHRRSQMASCRVRGFRGCLIAGLSCVVLAPRELASRPQSTPLHADYTETISGTNVRFDMVAIPGGTFTIGSPPTEPGRSSDEGPQQTVTIQPFWMERTEVTWDEYDAFAFAQSIPRNVPNATPA